MGEAFKAALDAKLAAPSKECSALIAATRLRLLACGPTATLRPAEKFSAKRPLEQQEQQEQQQEQQKVGPAPKLLKAEPKTKSSPALEPKLEESSPAPEPELEESSPAPEAEVESALPRDADAEALDPSRRHEALDRENDRFNTALMEIAQAVCDLPPAPRPSKGAGIEEQNRCLHEANENLR